MAPCPRAVGECQQYERQHKPEQCGGNLLCHKLLGYLSDGQLVERCRQFLGFGQLVVAPFADYHPLFEQYQTGIAADDGLERGLVGIAEWVFGPRDVLPVPDGLASAGREAVKRNLLCLTVLVQLVDVAEVGVVGMFQMGRDEQESIAFVREHRVGDVFPVFCPLDGKIVDGRHVAFLGLHGLAVYKLPCRVGIVVERELFFHTVLLQDKGGLILRQLGPFGNLHAGPDVCTHMIGAEVEPRQRVQAVQAGGEYVEHRIVDGYPLVGPRHKPHHAQRPPAQYHRTGQQDEILDQRLPVAECHGIAEAATVFYRVCHGYPHRHGRHEDHERQHRPGHDPAAHGQHHKHAERELDRREGDGGQEREPVGDEARQSQGTQIVLYLVLCAQRVDGLDVSGEDKRQSYHRPADIHQYCQQFIHLPSV